MPAEAQELLTYRGGVYPWHCGHMNVMWYTGKFDEALALLTSLEQGAPNLDQVFAARAFVLKKQNKLAEANAALAKARQYNRTIKEF